MTRIVVMTALALVLAGCGSSAAAPARPSGRDRPDSSNLFAALLQQVVQHH